MRSFSVFFFLLRADRRKKIKNVINRVIDQSQLSAVLNWNGKRMSWVGESYVDASNARKKVCKFLPENK